MRRVPVTVKTRSGYPACSKALPTRVTLRRDHERQFAAATEREFFRAQLAYKNGPLSANLMVERANERVTKFEARRR